MTRYKNNLRSCAIMGDAGKFQVSVTSNPGIRTSPINRTRNMVSTGMLLVCILFARFSKPYMLVTIPVSVYNHVGISGSKYILATNYQIFKQLLF
jgi:hypothetical protein